jgi:hypothetical protein
MCEKLLVGNHAFRYYSQSSSTHFKQKTKQTPGLLSTSELYRLSDGRLSAKLVPTLADKRYCVVSATNPHGR